VIKRETLEQYVEDAFLNRYAEVSVEGVADSTDLDAARQELAAAEADLEAFRDKRARPRSAPSRG
jgi:multidrug resistance efflux pump